MTPRWLARAALVVLTLHAGCATPAKARCGATDPAAGLGKPCATSSDCGAGQACHPDSHRECPGGTCRECQIRCKAPGDRPSGFTCNLPPLSPDSIPYICVTS